MNRSNILFFFIVIVFIVSCSNDSEFDGYTKTDSGLHYKLQEIGDGKNKPKIGDYLQLIITYKTINDSVFFDSYSNNPTGKVIVPFNHSSFKGSFEEGLRTMNEGDSTSFIVNAEPLFKQFFDLELPFFIDHGGKVKVDVKLLKILNKNEYLEELEHFKEIMEDRDIEEQRILKIYIDSSSTPFIPVDEGMYYNIISNGNGKKIEAGNQVSIHYKGRFLNGKTFESTYERKEPLSFIYGDQEQVIKGLEIGISMLNEGAKAKFIITSHLAFGESGSSNGRVPPFTTVIYELEVLKLNLETNEH